MDAERERCRSAQYYDYRTSWRFRDERFDDADHYRDGAEWHSAYAGDSNNHHNAVRPFKPGTQRTAGAVGIFAVENRRAGRNLKRKRGSALGFPIRVVSQTRFERR